MAFLTEVIDLGKYFFETKPLDDNIEPTEKELAETVISIPLTERVLGVFEKTFEAVAKGLGLFSFLNAALFEGLNPTAKDSSGNSTCALTSSNMFYPIIFLSSGVLAVGSLYISGLLSTCHRAQSTRRKVFEEQLKLNKKLLNTTMILEPYVRHTKPSNGIFTSPPESNISYINQILKPHGNFPEIKKEQIHTELKDIVVETPKDEPKITEVQTPFGGVSTTPVLQGKIEMPSLCERISNVFRNICNATGKSLGSLTALGTIGVYLNSSRLELCDLSDVTAKVMQTSLGIGVAGGLFYCAGLIAGTIGDCMKRGRVSKAVTKPKTL